MRTAHSSRSVFRPAPTKWRPVGLGISNVSIQIDLTREVNFALTTSTVLTTVLNHRRSNPAPDVRPDRQQPANLLGGHPQGIQEARLRYDAHSISGAQLCDYDEFRLYLAPKGGVVSKPTSIVFQIKTPDRVLVDAKGVAGKIFPQIQS